MTRNCLMEIVALTAATLLPGAVARAGIGYCDPDATCPPPCPCDRACYRHADCPQGMVCLPGCRVPIICECNAEIGMWWSLSEECAGECFAWPPLAGPPTHTIIDLGTLGGPEAHGNAVNNYGQVAGEAGLPGWPNVARHAFLWEQGQMQDLTPALGETAWTRAKDINNLGQVLVTNNYNAWLWGKDSGLHRIAGLLYAYAINDAGQVVGMSSTGLGSVLWQDGVIIDLSTIGIGGKDINNLGQIAGSIASGSCGHAAFWDGARVTDLGTLGGECSSATGVNDLGQVIGMSERAPGGDRDFYAFLWDNGEMIDLGKDVTPRDLKWVIAINNCGEVLLPGDEYQGVDFYVYHRQRGLRAVRGAGGPTSGWYHLYGLGFNDAGQIVGFGDPSEQGWARGFLISPVSGDFDWDGDADLADFAEFAARFTGSRAPAIPGCERADMDRDADVDLGDLALFHAALTGPQ